MRLESAKFRKFWIRYRRRIPGLGRPFAEIIGDSRQNRGFRKVKTKFRHSESPKVFVEEMKTIVRKASAEQPYALVVPRYVCIAITIVGKIYGDRREIDRSLAVCTAMRKCGGCPPRTGGVRFERSIKISGRACHGFRTGLLPDNRFSEGFGSDGIPLDSLHTPRCGAVERMSRCHVGSSYVRVYGGGRRARDMVPWSSSEAGAFVDARCCGCDEPQ